MSWLEAARNRRNIRTLRRRLSECEVEAAAAQRARDVAEATRDEALRQLHEVPHPEALRWFGMWTDEMLHKQQAEADVDLLGAWIAGHGADPAAILAHDRRQRDGT